MKKFLFKLFGIISLSLAIVGIFLPILPTTPFLLLSSFLFMQSSDKLHKWLTEHRVFGQYIKDFQEYKSIPLKVKITSISFLWITILLSVFFFIEKLWIKLLLISIAIGVTIHILKYKTKKKK
ncbi:MAG: YbaN family protein [Bacteroidales bacterium]|jgi:uncharacterized membrane protein YbaN (DUF454 family)|nr:YbaN family protein [Bacteroidales bacterium]MDD4703945.1 YbaN family protein [Bacteroidales bacterium]MDX9797858.1 YbaN family protein [Bacteroidales bacterium]